MLDSDLKRFVRITLASSAFKLARDRAMEQLEKEVQNKAHSCSPLTDPASVETLLRAQGSVRGVLRFFEILDELAGVEDDG